MKYLHYFDTSTARKTYYDSSRYDESCVCYAENTGDINYNKEWPEVVILTKTQVTDGYSYTTRPGLYSLIPEEDWGSSLTYKVYFNGVLFTNNAKNNYHHAYSDLGYCHLYMSSNSSDPYYKYYFYAQVDDLGATDMKAVLPDSFGNIGDKIKVRIERI